MKLSIIIVNWNVKVDLVRCLQSIGENQPYDEFEVIVVDNASADGAVDAIKHDFPNVIVIANSENLGFAAAINQGIKESQGQYVLFLNPDTIVHQHSLDALVEFMDLNPDVGACGPKLLNIDGVTYPSIGYVPTFRSFLYRNTFSKTLGAFRGHYKKLTTSNFDYDKQVDVEQLSGAALVVKRSLMREIGLMDESFFLYYEDVDLCLRIRKAGWRIVYIPEAVITHTGGRSTLQVTAIKDIILYRSMFIYLRKHKSRSAITLFSLVFKPSVIIKEILNVFSGTIAFVTFILLFNRRRQSKSLTKIKRSTIFLWKYPLEFIFKI